MRKVTLIELYKPDDYNGGPLSTREAGKGLFHGWGVDYEEFESGPGNFSTAIVEMPDGTVRNWHADMIRFDEKDNLENAAAPTSHVERLVN